MRNSLLYLGLACICMPVFAQQRASIEESVRVVKTYPFSDPDPVADPSDLFYPYFRFDGFSANGVNKEWKVVTLENDYIKVTMFPEIGGKVWGALDKTSGNEFIYNNNVVKFRDIAMRGPWVSGGIEFNFGIIGHAPTSSTPVDYKIVEKEDGSVSCFVASYELVTRTFWNVEVNLPKDKGYFTTTTTWYNQSSIDQPYYQWMNAGYSAQGNAQFCYPGNKFIGHGGEVFPFPVDDDGRDLSWYANNNFGSSKSEHVLGYYNDYYGVYWHDKDFGSIHHSAYDDKMGMKIFLWSLSRDGGIWEDLLTDADGQYIELQSGRMYNQPASNSGFSPYKHYAFSPQGTDRWTEYWYPVKGIKGVSKASRIGALSVARDGSKLNIAFSPLENLSTQLKIYDKDKLLKSVALQSKVLEPLHLSVDLAGSIPDGNLRIVIGNNDLVYSEIKDEYELSRPSTIPADYDWNSLQGLYTQGEQWMNQKVNDKAEHYLKASLEKDKYYKPSLNKLASLYILQGKLDEALKLLMTSLSLDTYDGEANYLYGLCNQQLGNNADAKDGYSVASRSSAYRSAAYSKLAEIFLSEGDLPKAERYALNSLNFNSLNLDARQVLMVVYRLQGDIQKAAEQIDYVLSQTPLYHPARFEKYQLNPTAEASEEFTALIRNELPAETYMEIADWYAAINAEDEALTLLSYAGDNPIAQYQAAHILHKCGKDNDAKALIDQTNSQSPDFVFPFRHQALRALIYADSVAPSWKHQYYQALIYWANQNKTKALELLDKCDDAQYAPLYLTRANLKTGSEKLKDIQRAENLDQSWRTGVALLNYYIASMDWKKAAEVGKKYSKIYPSNYYVGLKYAKALCENEQYTPCISLLRKLQVLPNEGSYAGKAVFRAANLYQAMASLKQNNFKKAVASVEASREWPENLGVGKPYDDMIDSRLEDYILAEACAGLKNKDNSKVLIDRVANYSVSASRFESANLLTALALRRTGEKEKADRMVALWSETYPDNKIAQWCVEVYNGNSDKAKSLLSSRSGGSADTTPWESLYRDTDFDLITKMF